MKEDIIICKCLRDELKISEKYFDIGRANSLEEVIDAAERYEKLRRLNVIEFGHLFELNLKGFNFDELVDELP